MRAAWGSSATLRPPGLGPRCVIHYSQGRGRRQAGWAYRRLRVFGRFGEIVSGRQAPLAFVLHKEDPVLGGVFSTKEFKFKAIYTDTSIVAIEHFKKKSVQGGSERMAVWGPCSATV